MKNTILILITILMFVPATAQEETLIGTEEITHGGFGGPVVKFTQVKDNFGVLVGGRGGWIINHTFVIGGGGYGLANNIEGDKFLYGEKQFINFGYGGLELEYINNSDKLVHYTIYTLIGAGGVGYRTRDGAEFSGENNAFFILEPAVNAEINLTKFFRIGLGASYRIIAGVNLDDLRNKDFAGPSGVLTLKFGKF